MQQLAGSKIRYNMCIPVIFVPFKEPQGQSNRPRSSLNLRWTLKWAII